MMGLVGTLTLQLHDLYGLPSVAAASFAAPFALLGTLTRPFGGWAADRFGGPRVLGPLLAGAALAAGGASATYPGTAALGGLGLFLACAGLANGVLFQILPRRFPQDVGLVSGIVGAAGGLGGFALAASLGLLRETAGSYGPGFAFVGGLSFAALVIAWLRKGWPETAPGKGA
jgi:NNP family nitrate/nitrite transporter-like MFS transporter